MASIFNENERKVRKLRKIAEKVEALAEKYSAMTDEELTAVTPALKDRLEKGETLDDILPDAYAAAREAAARVLGMRPFFVQVMGAVALHQGRIAEMGTGEGKTLVATMPAYLNALAGKGVHIITVNDYLAERDAAWMGKVYRFLGLSVGVIKQGGVPDAKRAAYACDVTYCTNNELGFDFLRDNMAVNKAQKVQRGLNFAVIDEVDSILIDEARTPLIISGRGEKSGELYKRANAFAHTVREKKSDEDGGDFVIEEKEKSIMLTDDGIAKAERYFGVTNLTDIDNTTLYHHIRQALKANYMMKRDRDYIVSDGEVLIVDEFTGRVMIGRRYNEGLHQAIEAKENVAIRSEDRTLATITFQNFFRMYSKLSGMTGTAKTEEEEFKGIYALDVVTIPPNLPSRRKDEHDRIYTNSEAKIAAIIEDIKQCYEKGQPVLVGTVSVEKSEQLSARLKRQGIRHFVLNAKHHKEEAGIIAQAGRFRSVTIATNMAGRGTDIMLGGNPDFLAREKMEKGVKSVVDGKFRQYSPEVVEMATSPHHYDNEEVEEAKVEYARLYDEYKRACDEDKEKVLAAGGLRVIGTERHESRRIDNQLRGRSGRQGDPGSTLFYVSLDDDVARIFGGDRMKAIASAMHFPDDEAISNKVISKGIERAQKNVESRHYSIRKQVLSYDDVINVQRELIYKERGKVLDGLDVHDQVLDMIDSLAEEVIGYYADYKEDYNTWDYDAFNTALEQRMGVVRYDENGEKVPVMTPEVCSCYDVYKLKEKVLEIALDNYAKKIEAHKKEGIDFGDIERFILLQTVDAKWIEHVDAMDALRRGIGLRGYGQRDPIISYREEGRQMFEDMVERIHSDTASLLLRINVRKKTPAPESNAAPKQPVNRTVVKEGQKPGRNDPCYCGSGKKYKNCHGRNE